MILFIGAAILLIYLLREGRNVDIFGVIRGTAFTYGIRDGVMESFAAHESGFDPEAVGDGGRSRGLFQIWEPTAKGLGIDNFETLFDPQVAADAAARLIRQLHDENGWDGTDLIAAYNAGIPRKNEQGQYVNSKGRLNVQNYVDKVTTQMLSRGIDPKRGTLFV